MIQMEKFQKYSTCALHTSGHSPQIEVLYDEPTILTTNPIGRQHLVVFSYKICNACRKFCRIYLSKNIFAPSRILCGMISYTASGSNPYYDKCPNELWFHIKGNVPAPKFINTLNEFNWFVYTKIEFFLIIVFWKFYIDTLM